MRRCAPVYPEQVQALVEIRAGIATLDLEIVEAFGEAAHAQLHGAYRCPPPEILARANGFTLVRCDHLARFAMCFDGFIYWRPCGDRRRLGFALYHEIAEGLLERSRMAHVHADVQLVMLALILPRTAALAGRGAGHPHAPTWALRERIAMLRASRLLEDVA